MSDTDIILEHRRIAAMRGHIVAHVYLTIKQVAEAWTVSREVVAAIPIEILPYHDVNPGSTRLHRRYHPLDVEAARILLRRWTAAKTMGKGEQFLRELREQRRAQEEKLLSEALGPEMPL